MGGQVWRILTSNRVDLSTIDDVALITEKSHFV